MKDVKDYLLRGTPSHLLPLGAGFVMASSNDIRAAIGMGIAVLLSMLLSAFTISLVKKLIPACAKLPAYVLIMTGYVTLIDMLMQAHFPVVVDMLGVHLAALAVSAVIYRDAEEVADVKSFGKTMKISLLTGLFFTIVMVICALVREVLGNASIWGVSIDFLKDYRISSLAGAFGGYLVLAITLAVIRKVGERIAVEESEEREEFKA